MDGDTRGGAALSIRAVTGKPIKFVSTGEKMEALDIFYPARVADRILGMGDVVSLVEKAQEQFDEKQARELKKKIAKNQFTLNEFYDQLKQVQKMGNIKDLAGMLPGMDKALKDVDIPDDAFKPTEAMIQSMTPFEREHPELINGSRRRRIAAGSGTTINDVNRLLKQFEQTRKMMKLAVDGSLTQRLRGFRTRLRTPAPHSALAAVKRSYRGPVSLHVAGQYLLDSLFAERLQSADLLCLEHRRVLVDASLYNPPQQFRELLTRTLSQGYVPVLAHPERYGFLSVEDCLELKETGVLFLLDIASLVSFYGEDVRERADELLRRDLYALSGTGVQKSLSLDTLLEYKFKSKIIKHIPR